MLDSVFNTIRSNSLLKSGDTVIVAVSGGADSVALLDILAHMKDFRLNLIVAHLNHCLRSEESDGDEQFVRELAENYQLQCEIKRVDVKLLGKMERLSLEEAGRSARYGYFRELREKYRANAIALGHHADDQAETVLMRLLRGAGGTGLAGMAPKSSDGMIRPLLEVSCRDIKAYLLARGLSWRTDSSNSDTDFLRNRIRHELLPCLETYNPAIRNGLAASAAIFAAENEVLEDLAAASFSSCGTYTDGVVTISLPALSLDPQGVRLRLYRLAIRLVKGNLACISYRHLHAIDSLVRSKRPNSSLDLPDRLSIIRTYDTLRCLIYGAEQNRVPYEITVDGPGIYLLPDGTRLSVTEARFPECTAEMRPAIAWFDREMAPFPWLVRSFRPGDRIVPRGMTGTRKVKDIYIDTKIPLEIRGRIPLLFSGGHLVWVCGLKVSARAGVTENTASVLKAEILDSTPWIDL
jgi:tRNA(Ile)-lysidine synthase